ncbi:MULTISPECIES: MuF-C-terminal domain-containing protein [Paraburkholderia]|uniref:MuF-C-terminal domain-containing protein n=1 Tax=Paraburkholderia TaxID=1822464 RepID=UPI001B27FF32|nr:MULTISPECIES: hypothetical protein [Paraburkholderia]MCX4152560.1 hypothetical protein [Paraburkholderia aspalathi]MDN7161975.1 hypothetical protein [Paraburkholderia sp. SECH2]MDQ6390461.1 hypothetical protein [Paraburkholderia aspalathi]CAE6715865.1 hypothetical protein R75465_01091 [Paraburkholderia aspalathi]CAE6835050.1 hypothetical protein R69746_06665 [Paraburkholderia aspalathi]
MSRFVRFDLSVELTTELLRRHQTGRLADSDYRHQVLIGRFTKEALTVINIPDRAVVTSVRLLVKIMEKHGLPPETVASLRELILKPVAVYESATERDSIVVVTIEMPDGINPLLVAIRVDVPDSANKPNMHWMVSAYAKNDPEIVKRWEANGLLIWKHEPVVEVTIEPAAKVEETATAESNT